MTEADAALAREIAEFVAERAFNFGHFECRAWALTDYGAWAALAGYEPRLAFGPPLADEDEASSPLDPPGDPI